jgi:hypothetical protein
MISRRRFLGVAVFRRANELSAELNVPILVHFQQWIISRTKEAGVPALPRSSSPS